MNYFPNLPHYYPVHDCTCNTFLFLLQIGVDFTGQLQIINKMDVPSAPPIPVPPKKEHPIPDTLRQRFIPFGAGNLNTITSTVK